MLKMPPSHKKITCFQLASGAISSLVSILGESLAALIKSVIPTDDFIGIVLDPMAWGSMAKTHTKVRFFPSSRNNVNMGIRGWHGHLDGLSCLDRACGRSRYPPFTCTRGCGSLMAIGAGGTTLMKHLCCMTKLTSTTYRYSGGEKCQHCSSFQGRFSTDRLSHCLHIRSSFCMGCGVHSRVAEGSPFLRRSVAMTRVTNPSPAHKVIIGTLRTDGQNGWSFASPIYHLPILFITITLSDHIPRETSTCHT